MQEELHKVFITAERGENAEKTGLLFFLKNKKRSSRQSRRARR
jgi:hypothetical protein